MAKKQPKRYPIYVQFDTADGIWVAEVPDLPGCMAHGNTELRAIKAAQEAMELWLESVEEEGARAPEPTSVGESRSGEFLLRLPISFKRNLQIRAQREHTSMNQLLLMLLAQADAHTRH